jgi:hypothetical protein
MLTCSTQFNNASAQDSTQFVIYDVLHLKDGRVLKGQILAYDSQLGGISFRDNEGRVFNFSREQYNYFVEKQRFPVKSRNKTIRQRNEEKIEITVGVNIGYTYMSEDLTDKSFYTSSQYGFMEIPISITAGMGKYFTRKHYFGAVADFGVIASPKFFNAGVKYKYEYDAGESNVSKYIPVDIRYQSMQLQNNYEYYDTVWFDGGGFSYGNRYHNASSSFSAATFSIGHGFGFILKNGGSFNIEFAYLKHFILSHKYIELNNTLPTPVSTFALQGLRLGLSLSF